MKIGFLQTVKVLFALLIIFAGYALCRTVVNYVFVSETVAQTRARIISLTYENRTGTYVNISFLISNPSHLKIGVYLVEYSLSIYNASSFASDKREYIGRGGYSGHEGQEVFCVGGGKERVLHTSVKVTSAAYLQNIEWIGKRQQPIEQQFDIAGGIYYKVYPFGLENNIRIGYWQSGGGSHTR